MVFYVSFLSALVIPILDQEHEKAIAVLLVSQINRQLHHCLLVHQLNILDNLLDWCVFVLQVGCSPLSDQDEVHLNILEKHVSSVPLSVVLLWQNSWWHFTPWTSLLFT